MSRLFSGAVRSSLHLEIRHDDGLGPPHPGAGRRPLLYIHIPFCRSLCPFCTFHRVGYDAERSARYFDALRREIDGYHRRGFRFEEVYVGGGTPTLDLDELVRTLDMVHAGNAIRRVSVETNPTELAPGRVQRLGDAGVDRLSVGVQSFDDELLRRLGRYEAYGSGESIIRALESVAGRIGTVNVDMMFNLPGQGEDSLRRDLDILTGTLAVDQVSFYPLMASPSARRGMERAMGGGPGSHEREYYELILATMSERYAASSAWCFSRDDDQLDEYIVDHPDYLGVGSGAFSYLDGVLYSSTFSIAGYGERVDAGLSGVTASRAFSRRDRLRYEFVMGLFATRLDRGAFAERHGADFERELWREILAFRALGAIARTNRGYRLTRRGMYLWVVMMREFFNGVNAMREQMRRYIHAERALLEDRSVLPVRIEPAASR